MTRDDRVTLARAELEKADVPAEISSKVELMLDTYYDIISDTEDGEEVLKLFTALVKGEAISKTRDDEWRWLDAKPGNVFVRDMVRVRDDAYPIKDRRNVHNGRVGVVVGIRYGTVSVHYTDGPEASIPASFTQHRLPLLEKRY